MPLWRGEGRVLSARKGLVPVAVRRRIMYPAILRDALKHKLLMRQGEC
jgi:hypothetical protein